MESTTFKSSIFGGFRRKDVIAYIEKSALESNQLIESLEKDTDGLTTENRTLRDEVASVSEARSRLSESLNEALAVQDGLRAELDAVNAELAALRAERDALKGEIAVLRPQAEEFAAVKANLTELELAARRRSKEYDAEVRGKADAYERETRAKVDSLLADVRAQCDGILSTLSETCENVTQQLDRSRAGISRLPAAFLALRHDLEDLRGAED